MSFDHPDDSQNPFAAEPQQPRGPQEIDLPEGSKRGKVAQVPILGVLMAVHGGLILLMGAGLIAMAFLMPEMMKNNPAWQNNPAFQQQPNMPPPDELLQMMTIGYGIFGSVLAVIGLLNLMSGIMVTRFRGRTFAIVALSTGLLTVFSCYCLPTALGLFVYGLIVLMDGSARLGFELADRGHTNAEIQQAFARLPLGQ